MAEQIKFDELGATEPKCIQEKNDRQITCCFTGHRDLEETAILYSRVRREIIRAYERGCRIFCTGGARGFDTIAAMNVLAIRNSTHPDIKLMLVLPFPNQHASWNQHDKRIFETVLKEANLVEYTAERYHKGCMFVRNRRLVQLSSCCISYLLQPKSGTGYTVKLAEASGLYVVNLAE
ncbi:MAG: DUF1273 family protein [Clostridia bacterium]|nr:DUF1273 family protein [Clostridia bacterium]